MAKYSHISKRNGMEALCGVWTQQVYFIAWHKATCPRCRAMAERRPDRVSWVVGTPAAEKRPELYWEPMSLPAPSTEDDPELAAGS